MKEWINSEYTDKGKRKEIAEEFKKAKPFPHAILKNFFEEEQLRAVLKGLEEETFFEKKADLFEYKQTADFKETKQKELQELYAFFMSSEFTQYIQEITGIKINGTIDMSSFIYTKTEYLLPHDDQLEGRKIAYVINLSEGFTEEDGGRLQLFTSENNKPKHVNKSYSPMWNSLVLFEVTPQSWHQIEEIITEKERIGITGWFHGN